MPVNRFAISRERVLQWLRADANRTPLLVLLALSAFLHLNWLDYPRQVVFDEVHFGSFSTSYCCSHQYIFDIHPPIAKEIIGGTAWLLGYRGGVDFANIGNKFGEVSPVPLRTAPALAGTALPLIIYALVRLLGGSIAAAFFAGLIIVFDNALTLQSRLITLDPILLASTFGTLALFLVTTRTQNARKHTILSLLTGLSMGVAINTKVTGLAVVGLMGVYVLFDVYRNRLRCSNLRRWFYQGTLMLFAAFCVFMATWFIHFNQLTEPGSGDAWGHPTGFFFQDLTKLLQNMYTANTGFNSVTHPDSSPWWSWPLMMKPLFYWSEGPVRLHFLGNPVVWWGGSLLFILAGASYLSHLMSAEKTSPCGNTKDGRLLWIPVVGYFGAYLPMMEIKRIMFMYHYMMPLVFSIIVGVLWLDRIGWIRGDKPILKQNKSYYIAILVLIAGFIYISPFTYALDWWVTWTDKMLHIFPRL